MMRRRIQLSSPLVPGLGRSLFSVRQAASNGIVSIFDRTNPRLQANKFALMNQDPGCDVYSFSLDLTDGSSGPELAMKTAADTNLWHRRLRLLKRKSLELLESMNNHGVSFDGPGQESPAGSSQDRQSQGQAPFPACFHRPDATVNSGGSRGLQVRC